MAFGVCIGVCFTFFLMITCSATAWNPFLSNTDRGAHMLAAKRLETVSTLENVFGVVEGEVDPDALAMEFIDYYYTTFDTNRRGLANLYEENSMLSFEGQKIKGSFNIISKYTSLPFHKSQHFVSTVDCQPSGVDAGTLIFVTGGLRLDVERQTLKFSQMFHLKPTSLGSYYVFNEMFRLNYA